MAGHTHYFQIGAIALKLSARVGEALQDYLEIYDRYRSDDPLKNCLEFRITRRRRWPWSKPAYQIRCSDPKHNHIAGSDLSAVLPEIEGALNYHVCRSYPHLLKLHAASLCWRGQGVAFPGRSGVGKTTLSAALIQGGWEFLCDEFALIELDSLTLQPFPKHLAIKDHGLPLIEDMGLVRHCRNRFTWRSRLAMAYLDPYAIRPYATGSSCPLKWVFMLSRDDHQVPALTPLKPPEAAMALYRSAVNRRIYGYEGFKAAIAIAQQARCFRLELGPPNQTRELLEDLLGQKEHQADSGRLPTPAVAGHP